MVACTFTTSMPLTPDFRVGTDTIGSHMDSLISAENFNFYGIKKSVNGTVTRVMQVTVTNGKNVPSEDQALRALGKTLATYAKSQLKDTAEYDLYDVRFESRKTSDGMTNTSFSTLEFKTQEL